MNDRSLGLEICQQGGIITEGHFLRFKELFYQIRTAHPGIKVIFHDEVDDYFPDARLHGKVCPGKMTSKQRERIKQWGREIGVIQ